MAESVQVFARQKNVRYFWGNNFCLQFTSVATTITKPKFISTFTMSMLMDKENAIENSPLAVRKAPTKTAVLGKPKVPQFQSPMVRAISVPSMTLTNYLEN